MKSGPKPRGGWGIAGASLTLLFSLGSTARAGTQTATTATATTTATVSAEELRLLEESLGSANSNPAIAAPSAAPPSTGGGLGSALSAVFQDTNPAIAVIFDAAASYFSSEPMQLGGHDPIRTGFTFQQLELSISGNVDPYFRFDTNIVFGEEGLEIEEAYASTLALPFNLQVRAGQFLNRFGRINSTHPHSWSFLDQPLVIGKFLGGDGNRGLGAEVSWLSPLPWYAELVASSMGAGGECCARSYYGDNDLGVHALSDLLYTVALKQFFPFDDDWSLFFGLSAQTGPNSTGSDNRTEIYGTDLYLRYRPVDSTTRTALSLQVEGLYRRRQIPDRRLEDAGFYAQLIYDFALQWEAGARFEYVQGLEGDDLDPDWTQARHRSSVALAYFPSHFSRIRAQGSYDVPLWQDAPIWAAMLNIEVLIGAHGAHGF